MPSSRQVLTHHVRIEHAHRSPGEDGMILRMWRWQADVDKASKYVRHATGTVFPKMGKIDGYRGAYLLRHRINGGVEFVVLTLWDSMEAVHKFTGEDGGEAVAEPEAQSPFSGFDDFVTHFEIIHRIEQP
jgi:heme-degrading monooxygenase HmoA